MERSIRRPGKKAVAEHRKRLKQRGLVRIELQARQEDGPLLRHIAGVLTDPVHAAEARRLLHAHFAVPTQTGLKELLAAAPLDGIDLERNHDPGRPIEL